MGVLTRNIAFFTSSVILAVFEIISFLPRLAYLFSIVILVVFFAVFLLTGRKIFNKLLWLYLLPPFLFVSSGFVFFYFLETMLFRQVVIFILFLLIWLLFKNYYLLIFASREPHVLRNILRQLSIFTAFFFFTSLFAFRIFLNTSLLILIPAFIGISFLLIFQNFRIFSLSLRKNYIFPLIILLLMFEIFFALTYLPTNFLVNGLFLTILYHLSLNLSRASIEGSLDKKMWRSYLILGLAAVLAIFLTAQWI